MLQVLQIILLCPKPSLEDGFTLPNDTSDIRKIEDEIAVGQIEEILSMAKDELELIDMYVENRAWEMVAEEQVRADMVIDKMSDTIYFSNPAPPAEEIEGGQEKK